MKLRRPNHATIVAYLALLIAVGTSAAWAATKITSSKQIKNGVVKGSDVKNASLTGKDVKDGRLSGADLGADSITGAQLDEGSLALGKGYKAFNGPAAAVHDGGGFAAPVSPQGDLVTLNLPAGSYLLLGHAALTGDDNGAGTYCQLKAAGESIETAGFVNSVAFGLGDSSPGGISVSTIAESEAAFTARLVCSDAGTGAEAFDRGLEAVSLTS